MDSRPGTYALVLNASQPFTIRVGRLSDLSGSGGFYIYVGSAFGPGGLLARVARHRREEKALHWHIDYLRQATTLVETWIAAGPRSLEHTWAQALLETHGVTLPAPGFGSSDCRCPAHLFYLGTAPDLAACRAKLAAAGGIPVVVHS
jgi:Uri superfamily endonuclease